ncbi:MAG: hypothetical protein AAB582_00355 [Patescibacteria group bacterium]
MKQKLLLVGVATLGVIAVTYLIWPEWFGFCEKIKTVTRGDICRAPYAALVGKPLLPFTLGFLLASLFAFFVTRKTHHHWAWFTLWYSIVAAILMLLAIASEIDVGMLTIQLFDIEKVAWFLAGIYAVISVLLLGISDFLIRRKR